MSIAKKEIAPILMIILMFVVGAILYGHLPAHMPSHWNVAGQVDGYISRNVFVFGAPAIVFIIYLILRLLFGLLYPFTKKLSGGEANIKPARNLMVIIIAYFSAIYFFGIFVGISGGEIFAARRVGAMILGALFIALGFLLPYFKRNYIFGIRMPWTLKSDEIWKEAHIRAKKWFIAGGLVVIIGGFLKNAGAWTIIAGIIVLMYSIIDSYFYFRGK